MEAAIEKGGKSAESNHTEHPMDNSDSPPIQRTVEGRVYSRLFTTDRDLRTKYIVNKYLYPTNYITLYVRMAYINSTLYITFL